MSSEEEEEFLKEEDDGDEDEDEIEEENVDDYSLANERKNNISYDSDINEVDSEDEKKRLRELYESNRKSDLLVSCSQCKDKIRVAPENAGQGPAYCMK